MIVINRVECDIVDVCNLKCVNCGHFTYSCIENKYSFEEFKSDVLKLSKISHIKEFVLMGGEPLILGNHLKEYIDVVRQSNLCDKLTIQSNGILIEKNEFIFSLVDNVILSLYKSSNYDNLKTWIYEKSGIYKNLEYIEKEQFHKIYDPNLTCEKSFESWKNCIAKLRCNFLYKGKYWKCAQSAKLYLVHGKNLDDGIDLYSSNVENDLKQFVESNIRLETCNVCCVGLPYQLELWREYEN